MLSFAGYNSDARTLLLGESYDYIFFTTMHPPKFRIVDEGEALRVLFSFGRSQETVMTVILLLQAFVTEAYRNFLVKTVNPA